MLSHGKLARHLTGSACNSLWLLCWICSHISPNQVDTIRLWAVEKLCWETSQEVPGICNCPWQSWGCSCEWWGEVDSPILVAHPSREIPASRVKAHSTDILWKDNPTYGKFVEGGKAITFLIRSFFPKLLIFMMTRDNWACAARFA